MQMLITRLVVTQTAEIQLLLARLLFNASDSTEIYQLIHNDQRHALTSDNKVK